MEEIPLKCSVFERVSLCEHYLTCVMYHALHGEKRVDVEDVAPPVARAVDVVHGGRLQHWVSPEPQHHQVRQGHHQQVRRRQPGTGM